MSARARAKDSRPIKSHYYFILHLTVLFAKRNFGTHTHTRANCSEVRLALSRPQSMLYVYILFNLLAKQTERTSLASHKRTE